MQVPLVHACMRHAYLKTGWPLFATASLITSSDEEELLSASPADDMILKPCTTTTGKPLPPPWWFPLIMGLSCALVVDRHRFHFAWPVLPGTHSWSQDTPGRRIAPFAICSNYRIFHFRMIFFVHLLLNLLATHTCTQFSHTKHKAAISSACKRSSPWRSPPRGQPSQNAIACCRCEKL